MVSSSGTYNLFCDTHRSEAGYYLSSRTWKWTKESLAAPNFLFPNEHHGPIPSWEGRGTSMSENVVKNWHFREITGSMLLFTNHASQRPDENCNIDSSQNPLHVGWSRSHVHSRPRRRGAICDFLAKSGSFGSGAQGCVPFANTSKSKRQANQPTQPTHFEYPQLPVCQGAGFHLPDRA